MPARDIYHNVVKRILEKTGWKITDDPLHIKYGTLNLTIGQFINYRFVLKEKQPERILYLAIPEETYQSFFILPLAQGVIQENHIKYFIYNVDKEKILKWQT
ncbi:MAG: fatty-acid oxidation protein subunit alpha [Gammaproteobacteria bacterium]|nr:MAG: fatty-acid oxidation protein subunit alpha [Gammaproteobacteria bacterium]RKZ39486.1 MAG: fatty-acid oxidation protein subunit alpha [Gammaproteobacteria bacterium]RKZ73774.1 MAG: fatty-acid oxidation protein subunit alpha [Gammaproteobacteria bacterium]